MQGAQNIENILLLP